MNSALLLTDLRPDSAARVRLAQRLFGEADYLNAAFVYASFRSNELDPVQWREAGQAQFRAGRETKARSYFVEAVRAFARARRAGADADLLCWSARAYGYLATYTALPLRIMYALRSKRFAEASVRTDVSHAFAYYVLGLWHQRMPAWLGADPRRSAVFLARAVELCGDQIIFRMAKARWHLAQRDATAARAELLHVIDLPLDDADDDRRKIEALQLLDLFPKTAPQTKE